MSHSLLKLGLCIVLLVAAMYKIFSLRMILYSLQVPLYFTAVTALSSAGLPSRETPRSRVSRSLRKDRELSRNLQSISLVRQVQTALQFAISHEDSFLSELAACALSI